MTTTRFLATALPYSLAEDQPFHASVFFTHRLEPESAEATVGDFPDTERWVKVLLEGRLELVTDNLPDGIPVRWASTPAQKSWTAVFPPETPVAGFAAPPVAATDQPWRTYPAHTMEQHAVDLHLGSTIVSPMTPPTVWDNPVVDSVLQELEQLQPAVRDLRNTAQEAYPRRDEVNLARKLAESAATLGMSGRQLGATRFIGTRAGYVSEATPWTSAVELLLSDREGEQRATAFLDAAQDNQEFPTPALRALSQVHGARRFYQREQPTYQERPDERPNGPDDGTTGDTPTGPQVPEQDFHQRAGSLGSTPALLREVGLVIDVLVESPDHRRLLAKAQWVAARFTPDSAADVQPLAPPRTWCESDGKGHWRAVSSGAWSGGALPLGLPRSYTVLDLDPDASGLKLEQHLRDLPRALATELNGDAVNAAPGSLRSTGFSIAKVDRQDSLRAQLKRAQGFQAGDDDATAPDLVYDDLVRGIRLEVWDDDSRAWHSVHERRVDVEASGKKLLKDVADVGFLQLTALNRAPGEDSPYHLHEVFVGWDGWSLSAPRPGKVIVHGDGVNGPLGEELVLEEPPGDAGDAVQIRSRVEPGTLPALRYGRRYSFRVRGVDLAGNSVLRPERATASRRELAAARERLDLLRSEYAVQERAGLLASVRDGLLARLPDAQDDDGPLLRSLLEVAGREDAEAWRALDQLMREAFVESATGELRVPEAAVTGVAQVDRLLRSRLLEQLSRSAEAQGAGLRRGVAHALAQVTRHAEVWRGRPQLSVDPRSFAELDDTRDPIVKRSRPTVPGPGIPPIEPEPPEVPVVTTPRPFLRWHPVPPPSLVARHPLAAGESLQRLVVRDDRDTERHVAPPKGTQLEAEQHGMFDEAIGSSDPEDHDRLLATALKERGTFLDQRIQDLSDPNGSVDQEGIALHARPGADPDQVTLDQISEARDTPLAEGQYVVHDTDQLVLPYLPDVLAHGVSLVFYDAGAPHALTEPRVLQTVVLPYAGEWPEVEPLRLVLAPGPTLGAERDGNRVTVTLPPGEQVRVAMSSALDEHALQVLGPWRSHPAAAGGGPEAEAARALLARAAANGWFWWLTPAHDLRLVHAVRSPVHPPQLPALRVLLRPSGLTVAALVGVVDVHGPSTERLSLEARWTEWVDDLATDGPVQVERQDVVLTSPVQPDERFGLLYLFDHVVTGTDGEATVVSHKAIQTFPDTHHRQVTYAARGVTRFAEFFDPAELPRADDPVLLGESRELTVVSSARPAVPEVTDVVPLLLWEQETEPEQPFALRRTRRSGARIWLERPWFSSGDGELLAVVLGNADQPPSLTSRWAKDPVILTGVPATTTELPLVEATDLLVGLVAGEVLEPGPGRPVTLPVTTKLVDAQGRPPVVVLGYQPEYHQGRRQWFVDVAMDPRDSLWPFVRMAVARYQPDSLADHELSPVALTDWVQPLPERTATANRGDESSVRLTVTGPIGISRLLRDGEPGEGALAAADGILRASRELFATVQELPDGGSDLEWADHARVRLPLAGLSGLRATWSAEVPLPEPVALSTPGTSERFRVLVEEYEYFNADPDEGPKEGTPGTARRLVYADQFRL
ncbi:MAG TPA: hypothetical protein VK045_00730 [Ornithinicoccus sp.]|nr:hypothetical protein [Ornithinicoccus sp.]